MAKNTPVQETEEVQVQSLGWKDPSLEEGMATRSSILSWRVPWTGAWLATVHRVEKSWTQLKQFSTHYNYYTIYILRYALFSHFSISEVKIILQLLALCDYNLQYRHIS